MVVNFRLSCEEGVHLVPLVPQLVLVACMQDKGGAKRINMGGEVEPQAKVSGETPQKKKRRALHYIYGATPVPTTRKCATN